MTRRSRSCPPEATELPEGGSSTNPLGYMSRGDRGSGKPPHVLLVEDDPDRVRLTEHAVETASASCQLTAATDGSQALEHLEDPPPEGFDLVLLDLDLPDVPGHDLCTRIRSHLDRSRVPIVVLTSSDDREDIRDSYRVGANSHVTKAVDFQTFRDDLEGILSYWLDVNQTIPPSL